MNCTRCGIEISVKTMEQRRFAGKDSTECTDCEHLNKPFADNKTTCRAWMGELDEYDRPLKNGVLYKPGKRLCRRSDCVKAAHIVEGTEDTSKYGRSAFEGFFDPIQRDRALVAEQYDRSYVTGVKLSYEELVKRVEQERYSRIAK